MIERPSPNHGPRRGDGPIDMLVLHYTGMRSGAEALERLCDPQAQVSAHYLIEEDGRVFRLVPEAARAWHAGIGAWREETDVNSRSIGIELVNPGHDFGYRPFPEPQMAALIDLCRAILQRHPISARNVIGHSDLAPARKTDPGELFDWPRLAAAGIGLWPKPELSAAPVRDPVKGLAKYGYDMAQEGVAEAFQRHFRPARIDGKMDEECLRLLAALLRLIDGPATSTV